MWKVWFFLPVRFYLEMEETGWGCILLSPVGMFQ